MNQEILETYFPGLVVKADDWDKCENYLKLKGIEYLNFIGKVYKINELDQELIDNGLKPKNLVFDIFVWHLMLQLFLEQSHNNYY